jgi:hypothetical protein
MAAAGASLVASAIVAFLMMRTFKNYSYEKYLEKMLAKETKRLSKDKRDVVPLVEMQQPVWNPQQPQENLEMRFGADVAAQMSAMNAWQAHPAYAGAWQAPVNVQPEYNRAPMGRFQDIDKIEDPMQSPQWDPREEGY